MRSLIDRISGRSCSTTIERGVELLLHPQDQRPERLRFALGDAGGGLVEADHPRRDREHRGELDDAPGAGRELGDVAVGVAAEAEEVDELAASACLARSGRIDGTHEQRAPERRAVPRLERELHGVAHGELGEQASRPGTCGRARARRAGARACG